MEGEGEEEAYVGWKNRASSRQHPSSEVENNEGKEAVGSQDLLPSFLFFSCCLWLLAITSFQFLDCIIQDEIFSHFLN